MALGDELASEWWRGGQLPPSQGFPQRPAVDEYGNPIVNQPELAAVPDSAGQQLGAMARQAFQAMRQDPAPAFTQGAAPIQAVPGLPKTLQENVAALSAQRNRVPDPLDAIMQLGGAETGGAALAALGPIAASVRAMPQLRPPPTSPIPIQPGDFRVSTRFPTAVSRTEDPLRTHLNVGLGEMQNSPGYEHNVGLFANYPGFGRLAGMSADEQAQAAIEHMRGNMNYLYQNSPEIMQQRSPLWYEGANRVAEALANRWGIPRQAVSGGIAAMSPQKDWFMNASLGERVGDTLFGAAASKPMTSEMVSIARNIATKPAQQELFRSIQGKTLSQLTDPAEQALWVRLYDEAHNPRFYRSIAPEGTYGNYMLNADGSPSSVAWGSGGEIAKAIRAMTSGGNMDVISPSLGYANKVRNFYNNIELPNDPRFGDVTIDTHAMAGGQLRPLSGNTPEVAQGFGSGLDKKFQPPGYVGPKGSEKTGLAGNYPIYAEAQRLSAGDQGILPRAGQSATWEPVRELFPDVYKTKENTAKIDDIWRAYDRGEISIDRARQAVFDAAGGIKLPSWARPDTPAHAPEGASTYRGDLPYSALRPLYRKAQRGGGAGLPPPPAAPGPGSLGQKISDLIRRSQAPVAGVAGAAALPLAYRQRDDQYQQ